MRIFCATRSLADVEAKYKIRKDAYSWAITGLSSGGICSFNAAWQMPDQFSPRHFLDRQLHQASVEGRSQAHGMAARIIPKKFCVNRAQPARMAPGGLEDQEHDRYGSWPLPIFALANALKLKATIFT